MTQKYIRFLKTHWYIMSMVIILLVALLLRFYKYEHRWGLAYDQAHDIAVARHALDTGKVPLVGPFSSGGPFQTGGQWYWLIMAGSSINMNNLLTPWVFMTMLYVAFVYCMIRFGTYLEDASFGLLLGVITALSTAQITQGTNLTNQSPLALTSLAALWCGIVYLRTSRRAYAYWCSFFVVTGALIHLQGAGLIGLPLILLILHRRHIRSFVSYSFLGGITALIPVIVFDIKNNFVNSKGFIRYITESQFNVSYDVLGRRWKTYLIETWPEQWGYIFGGTIYAGYALIGLVCIYTAYRLYRRTIPRWVLAVGSTMILAVVIVRYVRTPLYPSYFVFMHTGVFLLTAWVLYSIILHKKIAGVLIVLLLCIGTLYADYAYIRDASNRLQYRVAEWRYFLHEYVSAGSYAIYDFEMRTRGRSVPLSVSMDVHDEIDPQGYKIGVMFATTSAQIDAVPVIYGQLHNAQLVDLSHYSDTELQKERWFPVNPEDIYVSTQEWYSQK